MITNPKFAPRRQDLPFLARRSRPKKPAEPPAASNTPAAPTSAPKIDYRRPDREPATPSPAAPPSPAARPAAPAASSDSLDLSGPAPSTSGPAIDFSRPDRKPAAPPPAAASSLDLSGPASPPPPPTPLTSTPATSPPARSGGIDFTRPAGASTDSLDLSDPPAATPEPAPAPQRRPAQRVHQDVRVHGRGPHLLSVKDPTVTLTRLQSGIGQLSLEAVCSPEVGDLRLGAVYQLRSGGSLTVQHADGHRFGPPSTRRPVIVATREEYERISFDLRQIRDIERIGIYAYSESRTQLNWNGTLVLTTFGGARIELPLETLYAGRIAMLMSMYNLDGELVIRAELETIAGDVREAARAYGYDRITWRDERAPVD